MKNDIKIIVTTYNGSDWTLQPFIYLFNTYWISGSDVTILGETKPDFNLPRNFKFVSAGKVWPQKEWSNGLIKYLHSIPEQYVVILLDDYWINRTVDIRGVETLKEYMTFHKDILRIDLTMDRLYSTGPQYPDGDHNYDKYGHYDLVNFPGTDYQMSLQPGIWNKALLLDVLEFGWSPWDVELSGTSVVNSREEMIVLGTRQNLVSFTNGLRSERNWIDERNIDKQHLEIIEKWFDGSYERK